MTGIAFALFVLLNLSYASPADAAGDPTRGEYIARLGGCRSCHTDPTKKDAPLAGGLELTSPIGTFHVPNITPDRKTGIGGWSERDFIRAMTDGIAPDGSHYYPVFPFTSYKLMTVKDLLDLKAYLDTVRPVRNVVPPHRLHFPYSFRSLLRVWKWLFFRRASFVPDAKKSATWNRGAYLVTGPGHCGECHTARNFLGVSDSVHVLAGARKGPDGKRAPNITPHPKDGIGLWSAQDIVRLLKTGELPYGETVDSPMDDVVTDSTSHWTDDDLKSVAEYLLSLPERKTP